MCAPIISAIASTRNTPFSMRINNNLNNYNLGCRPEVVGGIVLSAMQTANTNDMACIWTEEIVGDCMLPSIVSGDKVEFLEVQYVNNWIFSFINPPLPEISDIVLFWDPRSGIEKIKRVVGLPKDIVEIVGGLIKRNNLLLPEPYLLGNTIGFDLKPVKVPSNHVFVLADNRVESGDSRIFGPLAISNIFGIVRKILNCNPLQ